MQSTRIERSALGRMAGLGDLYDARTDNFCGINMFNAEIPKTVIKAEDFPSSNVEFMFSESLRDKSAKLGISAELSLSIAGGLIPLSVSGSGKYLQEQKSSARSVRTTMLCDVMTQSEKLELFYEELKQYISMEAIKHESATHVVTQIYWGGNAYVSAELEESEEMSHKDLHGELALTLKMAIIDVSGKASVDWGEHTNELAKKVTFKLYGDVLPSKSNELPFTFEEACKQLKYLQEHITDANGGKGKPVKYILFPLSDKLLKSHLAVTDAVNTLYKQIEATALMACVQLFDDITLVKQQVYDLMTDVNKHKECLTMDVIQSAKQLQGDLEMGETALRSQIADALKAIRSGQADVSLLDKLKTEYLASDRSYMKADKKLHNDFVDVQKKMHFKSLCDKYNVKYVKGGTPIDKEITLNSMVYVLYASDDLMERFADVWEMNRLAFFDLAKAIADDTNKKNKTAGETASSTQGAPCLIFVDCSFGPQQADKQPIRIIQHKNSYIVSKDVAEDQANYRSINIGKSDAIESIMGSNIPATVPLKIPCPGSLSGDSESACDDTPRQWVCKNKKCRQPLQLGVEDDYFYCPCGRAPAASFTYRCEDKVNHRMKNYMGFNAENLRQMLMSLRPNLKGQQKYIFSSILAVPPGNARFTQDDIFDDQCYTCVGSDLCRLTEMNFVTREWHGHTIIAGIEVTYKNSVTANSFSVKHGEMRPGSRSGFVLRDSERIVSARIQHGDCLDQMSFTTNLGRTLGPYGGNDGKVYQQDFTRYPSAQLAFIKGHACLEQCGYKTLRWVQLAWSHVS